ncbi:hypothetical protein RHSIM_Rhsim13G0000300 [Rhododendron simsii]|uniref:Retrotransposon Copia-like N-terminal domain-containing protein n=1 Tax=Rhododendron simsii TaxID=118357 RepID=A0A834G4S8_RHOSS|nr:hypothetical protein RHSIM_Rhsim13G0000300 [Rhododendron simsii]
MSRTDSKTVTDSKIVTQSKTIVTPDLPRSITSKKLDGLNYLSWAHAVKVYLRGKRQSKFITDLPPPKGDASLPEWEEEDSDLMCLLWHSLEPHIATTVEFCDTSKQIWDALAESFSQLNNVSRVFELYEKICVTKQSGKSLSEYYSTLKSLWDQLLQHRPFTSDLQQQRCYWEDFMVASLLFGLDTDLSGFKDQILAGETLPTAANAYSRLSRSSLGQSSNVPRSVAPIPETSALVSRSGGPGSYRGPVCSGGRGEAAMFMVVVVLAEVIVVVFVVMVVFVVVVKLVDVVIANAPIVMLLIIPSRTVGRSIVNQIMCIKYLIVLHRLIPSYPLLLLVIFLILIIMMHSLLKLASWLRHCVCLCPQQAPLLL